MSAVSHYGNGGHKHATTLETPDDRPAQDHRQHARALARAQGDRGGPGDEPHPGLEGDPEESDPADPGGRMPKNPELFRSYCFANSANQVFKSVTDDLVFLL